MHKGPHSLKLAGIHNAEEDVSFYPQPFLGVNLYVCPDPALCSRRREEAGVTTASLPRRLQIRLFPPLAAIAIPLGHTAT